MTKRNSVFASRLSAALLLGLALPLSGCAIDEMTQASELQPYGGSKAHPILVQGNRAHVENCGDWGSDSSDTAENLMNPNHGCAVQSNIAAMAAYPQDLVQPRRVKMPPAQPRVAGAKRVLDGTFNGTSLTSSAP
jgi:Pilus biogenesis CpaD protein (pilus_cpaD)